MRWKPGDLMIARRTFVIVLAAVAATLGAGLLLYATLPNPFSALPSDQSVVAKFRAHRAEFDALVAKALPDSALVEAGPGLASRGFAIYVRGTGPFHRKLSAEEIRATGRSAYRVLLREAGMSSVDRSPVGGLVWFTALRNPMGRKGLVYSTQALAPQRRSLDGLEGAEGAGEVSAAFVPLDPHWYLFLQSGD